MSGLDEQFKDVPSCPLCKEKPAFWILTDGIHDDGESNNASQWVWYFQKDYKKSWTGKRPDDKRVQLMGVNEEFLNTGIQAITCRAIDIIYDGGDIQHTFRVGSQTFDLVMRHLRREVRSRGFVGN